MIEAGKVLQNRYRVRRQVGQGGMGAVYIATDERFGSTVAIKETLFTDEKFRKAFEREARLLNSLRHSALPRVSDHFIEGNGQFIVMEFIEGEDLSEQLEQTGKLFSVEQILKWADQLLDALDYLHSQALPVIHRDIKPQNLKLTPQGQVVLLDFGLAKGNVTNPESATSAKSVFGYSRNYASLEQIQGTGTDPRSDLYSLSATLYHLLTGAPPVDALTRAMNVLSDKADPLIGIDKIRPEVSPSVADVLHQAIALNANQRPATAREMRQKLGEALNGAVIDGSEKSFEGVSKQSEIKTEAFGADFSRETRLRPQILTGDLEGETKIQPLESFPTTPPKRRSLIFGAGALGLVLAGGALSGAYLYNPAMFGAKTSSDVNANVEMKPVVSDPLPANVRLAETNANVSNQADTANVSTNATPETAQKNDSTKETVKPTPVKTAETLKEDKVETENPVPTPNPSRETVVVRTPPEREEPPPPPNRNGQVISPEVWRKMTPKQRQQLRRALEMQRRQEETNQVPQRPRPPEN